MDNRTAEATSKETRDRVAAVVGRLNNLRVVLRGFQVANRIPGWQNDDTTLETAAAALTSLSARLAEAEREATEDGMTQMTLNDYARESHEDNAQWWRDLKTGERLQRNKGELLCLIHSEISEAMEGERKNLMDDKLPHRRMAEVELVDALIRIFDYAGAHGYDLEGAYQEKRAFNKRRADHKAESRLRAGGKQW